MIPLIRKEARALAPYAAAFAALVLLGVLRDLLSTELVTSALGTRYGAEDSHFFVLLLGLLLGHGLVAHEVVNGHVELLDGLPTTRGQIYTAKVIAGTVLLAGLVLVSVAIEIGEQVVVPVPHMRPSWRPILVDHLVMSATLWFGFGTGLLLSWVRGLAVGAVVVGFAVGSILVFAVPPLEDAIPLPGSGYGELTWVRGVASHPIGPPAFWAALGTLAMLLSGVLFQGPGAVWIGRGATWIGAVRWVGLTLGAVALSLAGLGGVLATQSSLDLPEPIQVLDPPGPLRILYTPSNARHVLRVTIDLAERAEAIGQLIGTPLPEGPLDVELLGAQPNHGGVFTGGKIRVETNASAEVLTHELAHALAFERLGPAGWRHSEHTRFFNEGLANWVDDSFTGDGRDPVQAAMTFALDQARFDLLVEDERLVREQDIEQAYHLGEVYVRALVDVVGRSAIPCVLDALAQLGRHDVTGLALWYGVADRCAFDLDAVTARWRARLAAAAEALPPLPRLRVERVEQPGAGWALAVTDEAATGWPLRCRFRSDAESQVDVYRHVRVGPDGRCDVPLEALAGPTYDYQVGFVHPGGKNPEEPPTAFLPWVFAVPRRPR